jgi:peptidoglycan hydrolase FlgJ
MSPIAAVGSAVARQPDTPAKINDAAQQFEALLLDQILKAARPSGGWMGSSDSSADCAMDYAQQQFAIEMSKQGGLGLAKLIAEGLERTAK